MSTRNGESSAPKESCLVQVRQEALQWALLRGSRSGRVAWQFARDWAGRQEMQSARKRK